MSTISASTTSTTAYKVTADTTGTLVLQTGSSPTTAATIDTNQQIGVGVAPNSGWSGFRVIELQYNGAVQAYSGGGFGLGYNAYFNGSSWIAKSTGSSCKIGLDSNGGFSFQQLASVTGGSAFTYNTAMLLDASGNLLVGGTTARTRITLQAGEANAPTLGTASGGAFFGNSNVTYGTLFGTSGSGYGWIQQQRVDGTGTAYDLCLQPSGGQIGIGITGPVAKLDVFSSTADAKVTRFTLLPSDNNFQLGFKNGASGSTAGTSFGRLSGWYGGTELAYIGMTRSGGAQCQDIQVVCGSGGVYITNGGTSWSSLSDERQKTDLTPIENAAAKVATLRTVTGRYITDEPETRRAFLIAQDVQAVLPEAVNVQVDEAQTLGLQYTDVIPLLAAAIKEQQAIIETLTNRITALEAA